MYFHLNSLKKGKYATFFNMYSLIVLLKKSLKCLMEKLLKTIVEYRSAKERVAKQMEAKMGSNLRESQIYVSMKCARDLSDLFTVYNR